MHPQAAADTAKATFGLGSAEKRDRRVRAAKLELQIFEANRLDATRGGAPPVCRAWQGHALYLPAFLIPHPAPRR